jgi:hypothetical protein
MAPQHTVGRDQSHILDLALREQHAVERVVGVRLIEKILDGVMLVDGKDRVAERRNGDRQLLNRRYQGKLSKPRLDRNLPEARDTDEAIVGGGIEQQVDLRAQLFALPARDRDDDVAVEQQPHFRGDVSKSSGNGVIRKSSGSGSSKSGVGSPKNFRSRARAYSDSPPPNPCRPFSCADAVRNRFAVARDGRGLVVLRLAQEIIEAVLGVLAVHAGHLPRVKGSRLMRQETIIPVF